LEGKKRKKRQRWLERVWMDGWLRDGWMGFVGVCLDNKKRKEQAATGKGD
jgi:hypothetical protein